MEDLIACLYPLDENGNGLSYAHRAVENPENSSRLLAGPEKLPELPGRGSRESTAPLNDDEGTNTNRFPRRDRLQLTFSYGPKAGPGFVLGTDANVCDVVLPPLASISRRHCFITFDPERRLIVQDCSKNGTTVTYDGQGVGQKRRNFTWIIAGDPVPDNINKIVIELDKQLKFQIVVSKPSLPHLYLENVDNFRRETAASLALPMGALGMQSTASTVANSGTYTPTQNPIFLKEDKLGSGGFATVTRVWDCRTSVRYACKTITDRQKSDWKKEATLMRQTSHEHLVRLHYLIETPNPQLILEYLPLGDLRQLHRKQSLSMDEMNTVLVQGLSAIDYLHAQTPPIVHRDIKPENILVQSRSPLLIKIGDFGLSKASINLRTLCGTPDYFPPEFFRYSGSSLPKYTHAVDIWSFGVVVCEFAYPIPYPGFGTGLRSCMRIVKWLNDREPDDLVNILSKMVVIAPERRLSAKDCLENALELNRSSRSSTPKPGSYPSSQLQVPHAGSASPTQESSTCELYELRNSRPKRQRCPAGDSDEDYRTIKPFSRVHSISSASVLELLNDIKGRGGSRAVADSQTSVYLGIVCQHLERLRITGLETCAATERTIVTAVAETHKFELAAFTASECASSIADLAQQLANILQLRVSGRNESFAFNDQLCSGDTPVTEATQCVKANEETVEDGSPPVPTVEPYVSNRLDTTTDSINSWSTLSDGAHPTTFPSALLDVLDGSCCTIPELRR